MRRAHGSPRARRHRRSLPDSGVPLVLLMSPSGLLDPLGLLGQPEMPGLPDLLGPAERPGLPGSSCGPSMAPH